MLIVTTMTVAVMAVVTAIAMTTTMIMAIANVIAIAKTTTPSRQQDR